MAITVLTASNTQRLTTLAAVLAEITLDEHLLFAESLIDQASAAVARYCDTIFAQQEYREIQTGEYRTTALFLRYAPLVSVDPVTAGTTEIEDYRIQSAEGGWLYRREGWYLGWSTEEEWTVDYIAGYILPEQVTPPEPTGPTLPDDIERATIESVKVWFHERMVAERIEARTLGDQRIDYGVQARHTGLPTLAKDLLEPWHRLRLA